MKFSAALVVALLTAPSAAFAPAVRPSRPSSSSSLPPPLPSSRRFGAATLESPSSAETPTAVVVVDGGGGGGASSSSSSSSEDAASATTIVEKAWPVADFVKDSDRVLPGRYNDRSNSIALPFLPRPTALDGSHAGDYGFDPLGLSEKLDLYAMQESEARHSRLAMLAVVGWPTSELLAPSWMLQDGGRAPSVLNGVNPLSFLAIAGFLGAAGYLEYRTSLRRTLSTPMGRLHERDMSAVWKYGVAGDYNWDPMNLYSSCGDDYKGRKGLRDVELSHGRVAMLGITYFAAWEALTGHPIVENNMLFHPNLLFPLLVAAYAGWGQIYEVGPLNEYPIEIRYTNEGEMKLNRLQRGIQDVVDKVATSTRGAKAQLDVLDSKFGIYEKVGSGGTNMVEAVKSTYNAAKEGYLENVVVGARSED
ncbi:hypothetical protein ACHAW5_006646 [Stephanodiscus triporus]|uniref:Uncharacterized protein n=1 Tax=Stephanodiscus triporus TaxID=2934178 RepID=A0ABD3QHT8_9STRA